MNAKSSLAGRLFLGLIYTVFGLNGFLNFIPMPTDIPADAMNFSMAMMATGYFFPVLKMTEVICGALLLLGVAVPLALVVLAPITIHIFLFHAFLTPGLGNSVMPVFMIVCHVFAATAYWHLYKPLFK